MKCYSLEHLTWCFSVGLPGLVIWGIGIPLSAFIILFRNRDNLDEPEIKRYYLMIYQGFKKDKFYWEFVNTARKVSILSVNVFLSRQPLFYRIALIFIMLFVFFRFQLKLNPYKNETNNNLEQFEVIAGICTVYGGILFIDNEHQVTVFNIIAFIGIIVVNSYFVILWIFRMLS